MNPALFAYTGRVSANSSWAPILNDHGIREMTNRTQKPARTPFALDNGAYIDWRQGREFDEPAYLKTLLECLPLRPDFVIIPDQVAGGLDSLSFSLSWIPRLRAMMPSFIPLALAVQDGMEPQDIEPYLGQFDMLFIGGSRPWKYRTGERWCKWAKTHGLPVHIGAIGSMIGVRWARAIGANSIDSTSPLWSKRAMNNWLMALGEFRPVGEPVVTPKINAKQKPPTRGKARSRDDIGAKKEHPIRPEEMTQKRAMNLLGLQGTLSESAVKSAFRKKALEHHPDRGGSTEKFQQIRNAYEFLMKSSGRADVMAKEPKTKSPVRTSRVGMVTPAAKKFHDQMMGDVKLRELNEIRREFGDAHLRGLISDEDFLTLENEAAAVYAMLQLENASLPKFTERTIQTQAVLNRWISELQDAQGKHLGLDDFKKSYRNLEQAYKAKKISAFDIMTIQPIAYQIFRSLFHKDWPGTFGYIVDPNSVVAGASTPKKKHRVGAALPSTDALIQLWKDGEDIQWGGIPKDSRNYFRVLEEVKQAASDPQAPSEFLEWLWHQNKNARAQIPHAAVYDIPPYEEEILSNPSVSAKFALQLAANTGYGSYVQPHKIFTLLKNSAFQLFWLEDPAYMDRVFQLIQKVHYVELPGVMSYLQEIPITAKWLGPQEKYYTFKKIFKQNKDRFNPWAMPESAIVYRNGVVDLNFRTIKDNKTNQHLYRSLADVEKVYGPSFTTVSDQEWPRLEKASPKAKKNPTIAGVARVSRVGAISSDTQTLLDIWKEGRKLTQYSSVPELDGGNWGDLRLKVIEAASSPEVPSAFLLWLVGCFKEWVWEPALKNPNLSLEDAFKAIDERTFRNQWKDSTDMYYIQLPYALHLLDNFSFQLFLLEDPSLYERLFSVVQPLGFVANKYVYRDQVAEFLSHPVMQKWLGSSKTYTFKKIHRTPLSQEPDKSLFPLSVTVYDNGVVWVERIKSEQRDLTPLFRELKDFLDIRAMSHIMSPQEFLAKSDQMSAKRKGKQL